MEPSRGTAHGESARGGDGLNKGQRAEQRSHTHVCVCVFSNIRVVREEKKS